MTAKKKPVKKIFKKKEKYISEKVLPSGSHVLKVEIRLKGQSFRKNVPVNDFATPSAALQEAVRIRDKKLAEIDLSRHSADLIAVKDLYKKSYDLFPVSMKTRYRHDIYYKHVLKPYEDTPIQSINTAMIQESVNKYALTHSKYETGKMLSGSWRRLYKTAAVLDLNVPDRTAGIVVSGAVQPDHRKKDITPEDLETFCL